MYLIYFNYNDSFILFNNIIIPYQKIKKYHFYLIR